MIINLETILYEIKDNVGYICINMPPANKMISQFFKDIVIIINSYITDEELIGVIIYGAGRHYSSGADIDQLLDMISSNTKIENGHILSYPSWYIECKRSFDTLYHMNIPIISVMRGFCIGSGYELALSSHIRICEKGARIGLPEATFGLLPGINGTLRTCEELGIIHAFELILKGDLVDDSEALRIGLIDIIVKKNEGLNLALEFINYLKEYEVEYDCRNNNDLFKDYIQSLITK